MRRKVSEKKTWGAWVTACCARAGVTPQTHGTALVTRSLQGGKSFVKRAVSNAFAIAI